MQVQLLGKFGMSPVASTFHSSWGAFKFLCDISDCPTGDIN
jgi:hypothetical protein